MGTAQREARHVVVDGQHYAEIEGRRYPIKLVNGVWCLKEDDVLDMAKRFGTPEQLNILTAAIRKSHAEIGIGSGRIQ